MWRRGVVTDFMDTSVGDTGSFVSGVSNPVPDERAEWRDDDLESEPRPHAVIQIVLSNVDLHVLECGCETITRLGHRPGPLDAI